MEQMFSFKISNNFNDEIIKSVFFVISDFHLNHTILIGAQNSNEIQKIIDLQKKSNRIISIQSRNSHSNPSFTLRKIP